MARERGLEVILTKEGMRKVMTNRIAKTLINTYLENDFAYYITVVHEFYGKNRRSKTFR